MDKAVLLHTVAETCQELLHDAVNGISTCRNYEDATLIGFMQLHQLLGLRRLMLPLAAESGVTVMAESVFNHYLNQLEDVKNGSRGLLQVKHAPDKRPT